MLRRKETILACAMLLCDTRLFEADDATFRDAGKVGLWTKADSVTSFDDLTMKADAAR